MFVAVDLTTATVVAGPEIHARGFAEDDEIFHDVLPGGHPRPWRRLWPTAAATRTPSSRWCAARWAAGSAGRTDGAR